MSNECKGVKFKGIKLKIVDVAFQLKLVKMKIGFGTDGMLVSICKMPQLDENR
ncbi:MAG: hypothetical protein HKO54_07560 [Flavobacteriaceae bacterium]|nr:hypothetical protein [Flavobacteriaceae bacterium]